MLDEENLNQREIATKLSISQQMVSKYLENAKSKARAWYKGRQSRKKRLRGPSGKTPDPGLNA
jgi:predicted transcriptional regulator